MPRMMLTKTLAQVASKITKTDEDPQSQNFNGEDNFDQYDHRDQDGHHDGDVLNSAHNKRHDL